MELENGRWVACILADGVKAVGIVREEHDVMHVYCITEDGAVTTVRDQHIDSWCQINVDWEEA